MSTLTERFYWNTRSQKLIEYDTEFERKYTNGAGGRCNYEDEDGNQCNNRIASRIHGKMDTLLYEKCPWHTDQDKEVKDLTITEERHEEAKNLVATNIENGKGWQEKYTAEEEEKKKVSISSLIVLQ